MKLYRDAWKRFAGAIDDYPNGVKTAASPSVCPETTRAFQAAVDGAQAALDIMKREARQLGCVRWTQ